MLRFCLCPQHITSSNAAVLSLRAAYTLGKGIKGCDSLLNCSNWLVFFFRNPANSINIEQSLKIFYTSCILLLYVLFFFLNLHTTVFLKTHVKFNFHLQNPASIVLRRPTIVPSCILLFFVSFKNPPLLLFLLHLQRTTKFQRIVDFPCFNLLHFNPPLLLFLQKPTKPTKLGLSLLLLLQGINFSIFI